MIVTDDSVECDGEGDLDKCTRPGIRVFSVNRTHERRCFRFFGKSVLLDPIRWRAGLGVFLALAHDDGHSSSRLSSGSEPNASWPKHHDIPQSKERECELGLSPNLLFSCVVRRNDGRLW